MEKLRERTKSSLASATTTPKQATSDKSTLLLLGLLGAGLVTLSLPSKKNPPKVISEPEPTNTLWEEWDKEVNSKSKVITFRKKGLTKSFTFYYANMRKWNFYSHRPREERLQSMKELLLSAWEFPELAEYAPEFILKIVDKEYEEAHSEKPKLLINQENAFSLNLNLCRNLYRTEIEINKIRQGWYIKKNNDGTYAFFGFSKGGREDLLATIRKLSYPQVLKAYEGVETDIADTLIKFADDIYEAEQTYERAITEEHSYNTSTKEHIFSIGYKSSHIRLNIRKESSVYNVLGWGRVTASELTKKVDHLLKSSTVFKCLPPDKYEALKNVCITRMFQLLN